MSQASFLEKVADEVKAESEPKKLYLMLECECCKTVTQYDEGEPIGDHLESSSAAQILEIASSRFSKEVTIHKCSDIMAGYARVVGIVVK